MLVALFLGLVSLLAAPFAVFAVAGELALADAEPLLLASVLASAVESALLSEAKPRPSGHCIPRYATVALG